MKALSKEQRAAKFAANPQAYGLRSRGHRKLTLAEQQQLFDDLPSQTPNARLSSLRILREAIYSGQNSTEAKDLAVKVYATSITESIIQNQLEAVPPMLAHITTISEDIQWVRLYSISLANSKQFNEAFKFCHDTTALQYVTSVVTEDWPLRRELLKNEKSDIALRLMRQIDGQVDAQKLQLESAFRHPALKARAH